jgi:hypothetical protein
MKSTERSNLDLAAMRERLARKPAVEGGPFLLLPS